MNDKLKTGFADRLQTAAAARQALLAQMRPKPTQIDPGHAERDALRAAELESVRQERAEAKAAKREAAAEAQAEVARQEFEAQEAALQAVRGARKERKALSAAEAKAKRDAKYAARKARQ